MTQTGNPVLFIYKGLIHLITSYFDDIGRNLESPKTPVDRWKFCSLWHYIFKIDHYGNLSLQNISKMNIDVGYLARCAPIIYRDEIYLPLYREMNPMGTIMKYNGKWSFVGNIGENINYDSRYGKGVLIQPTIWRENNLFKALCRDITRNKRAWYSESSDGVVWSKPVSTDIWNDNNSIIAINNTKGPLIIWNEGEGRSNLNLGRFEDNKAIFLKKLNERESSSYPNYHIDEVQNIHIVYTDGGKISYKVFREDDIEY